MIPILIATTTPGFGQGTGGLKGGGRLLKSLVLLVPFLGATSPSPHGGTSYLRVFEGSCPHVDAMALMYKGDGDNEGSTADRAMACTTSCATRRMPLTDPAIESRLSSWGDYVAKGFALNEDTGRCWCQMDDSATCTRGNNAYYRYDIIPTGTCSLSLFLSVSVSFSLSPETDRNIIEWRDSTRSCGGTRVPPK